MAEAGSSSVLLIDNDGDSMVNASGELQVSIGANIDIGDVEIKGHVGVSQFTTNIAASATVLDTQACKHADIMANLSNTGVIYIGASGVGATTGVALNAGDVYSVDVTNTDLLYALATVDQEDIAVVTYN